MAAVEHTPDYPPKTPPPPKRPVSPPRPETNLAGTARARMQVRNRRSANWSLEAAVWSPRKASGFVLGQLHEWGYREADQAAVALTELLVRTAVADGGRRVSVHLADQNRQALIVALSHQPGLAVADDTVLAELTGLGAVSCGTDTAEDGRRLWAVLDL
ncbi:hypothetical protein N7925_01575 [Streptomyces sp. CA-278952]|uniref:hypothetical protein n=1 Tax=unclassified Streptomyces TaxID=2593676 RepID=UPI002242367E|nr:MULTISPECIES: hypothetical protein [unclassified Streptomyces]UZI26926.1 hypothetical protein OH133_01690 [Streptomyces sp. VB1]WDG27108.1 hypothetical protein N7925_01575 [Streptomyces sp. CA-278952]